MIDDRHDGADRLLAAAAWLLPPARREWGRAMRAELAATGSRRARWAFATGCLRAAVWPDQLGRAGRYAVLVAAAVAVAVLSGATGVFRVEVIGLGVLAPVVVWRLGYRDDGLGVVGSSRAARVTRRLSLAVLAGCLAVGVGTIAVTLPRYGGAVTPSGAATGLTLLAGFLTAYTALALAVTSRAANTPGVTLATGAAAGTVAGLAWCVLMPFDQTYAVSGGWMAAGYWLALGAVVVGAPVAAAGIAGRRTASAHQATVAAAGTGGFAALVILAAGWITVWWMPGELDTSLFDKGPAWRPPDMVEQVITSYLGVLVVAPVLATLLGWVTGQLLTASRRGRAGALAVLVAGAALVYPAVNAVASGDRTRFGGVGATDVVFSPAGGSLLTGNGDNTWILWSVADPARPRRLRTFNDRVVYSPDGQQLAARNVLWSLADPARPARIARFDGGEPVAYDASGGLLATHPTRESTTLWRVTDAGHPARLGTLPNDGGGVFFPDGRTYVAYADDTTTLWDVRDPTRPVRLAVLAGGGAEPLSPDGTVLATATTTGTVLWNVRDPAHPRRIAVLDGTQARPVFSPDSRTAAVGSGDGGVTLYDTATGALVATLPSTPGSPNNNVQIGASDTLTTVAFGPDGRTLSVITGNATVSIWTLEDRRAPVRTGILTRHTAGAGRVMFSPDTTVIAGAAVDGGNSITLWRLVPSR